jgi:hypothetical protein
MHPVKLAQLVEAEKSITMTALRELDFAARSKSFD